MTLTINGRIESTDSDSATLGECRVEVFFEQIAPAKPTERQLLVRFPQVDISSTAQTNRNRVSTRTDPTGHFKVNIPDESFLGKHFRHSAELFRVQFVGTTCRTARQVRES